MNDNTELIGCVSHDCAACKKQADALETLQAAHTDEVMKGLMLEKAHAVILAGRDSALARERHTRETLHKFMSAAGASPQPVQHRDALVVNLLRLTSLDKHTARAIADAAISQPVQPSRDHRGEIIDVLCDDVFGETYKNPQMAQPAQPSPTLDAQDAARYRWFADIAVSGDFEKAEKAFSVFEHSESCTKQEVDAAIDAAINAKENGND